MPSGLATETQRDLARRWTTKEGQDAVAAIVEALRGGESLEQVDLPRHGGRLDLRYVTIAPPNTSRSKSKRFFVEESTQFLNIRRGRLADLDLSGAQLESLRFFESQITNCIFDNANLRDWRLWATCVDESSFVEADLRDSSLGAWYEPRRFAFRRTGRGNRYHRVNFSRADLRGIEAWAASFIDCDFSHALLRNVDFQASTFVRCRFAGPLYEVIFWDRVPGSSRSEPNRMEDVDFSYAELRFVEFRGLDLKHVHLPANGNHIFVKNYPCVLNEALTWLRRNPTRMPWLRAYLETELEWLGRGREVGVFNRQDFAELGGEEEAEDAVRVLRKAAETCANEATVSLGMPRDKGA
jgi:uncharacterized protein YjbI with pentapeptide repeats